MLGERTEFRKHGGDTSLQSGTDLPRCVFMISHTGPFLHRPTAVCLYDIPYRTVLAETVRPVEGQVAIRHRKFVYCKIWVAEIKLERSDVPLGSAVLFKYLRS